MPCFGNAALKNTSMVGMWKMSIELKNSKPILGCKALWQFLIIFFEQTYFWIQDWVNKNELPAWA